MRKPVWPPVPYCHSSGQARVKIDGKPYYLGVYGSPEARLALRELVKCIDDERAGKTVKPPDQLTVADLVAQYLDRQAKRRKSADGKATVELGHIRRAVRTLVHALGPMLASEVEQRHLEEVRDLFINGYRHPNPKIGKRFPQARKTVNANFVRVRAVFKWGSRQNLLSAEQYGRLALIPHLNPSEAGVKELPDVAPVPEADLAKTIPCLGPNIREMVQVQLLCGCRAGEVCNLRPGEVDRTKPIWEWRPKEHKTAWRGHERLILLGPEAQKVLAPFLVGDPALPCFSPRVAYAHGREKHGRDDATAPTEKYSTWAYGRAIARACKRAGVPIWSPGQLRHNAATRFVDEFGWEIAAELLGHKDLKVTQGYAKMDIGKIIAAAKRAG